MDKSGKLLVITLGDPLSVNIEIVARVLSNCQGWDYPILIVGSLWHFNQQQKHLYGTLLPITPIHKLTEINEAKLYFWDPTNDIPERDASSLSIKDRGMTAITALEAIRELDYDHIAVLTCPITKSSCSAAGFKYPGHTEYFCDIWGGGGIMILAGPRLRVGLVTNHEAIADLPKLISHKLVVAKALLFSQSLMEVFKRASPRIAICGFNPHCGDEGMFGDEEQRVITPAVETLRERLKDRAQILGPLPADSAFFKGYNGEYDGVLALYHDQGLAPLKTVHFYDAVNITFGLKHFRASPDHGPASELYLKKEADDTSFKGALSYCKAYLDGC